MKNLLKLDPSPYLQQHKDNPVHWQTWTKENLNLAKEKNEQKTERFAIGEKIDSVIISFDQKNNFINLSVKQKEVNEEKEALNQYGSSVSGASLGDILGKVLKKKK